MQRITKKLAIRRVRDLQEIMDACYDAAERIVSARREGFTFASWDSGIKALDHFMNRVDLLSSSHARTLLARELFSAVIRGDLTLEDVQQVREGSEADEESETE